MLVFGKKKCAKSKAQRPVLVSTAPFRICATWLDLA